MAANGLETYTTEHVTVPQLTESSTMAAAVQCAAQSRGGFMRNGKSFAKILLFNFTFKHIRNKNKNALAAKGINNSCKSFLDRGDT